MYKYIYLCYYTKCNIISSYNNIVMYILIVNHANHIVWCSHQFVFKVISNAPGKIFPQIYRVMLHSFKQSSQERIYILIFSGDDQKPRTTIEMSRTGFLKAGTCLGISGRHSLEFWPTTVVAIMPCVLMVLDQVVTSGLYQKGHQ